MLYAYRVEKNGHGPTTNSIYYWEKLAKKWNELPNPNRELWDMNLPPFFNYEYVCAAKTKKQLQKWFTKKDIENLKEEGFSLNKYFFKNKEDITFLEYQAIFKPEKAFKVEFIEA